MSNVVFALDIGTRKILGIVAQMESGKYRVLAAERQEHPDRSMFDGQIHQVDDVAKVVLSVKSKLEEKLGRQLKEVAVAAAGRSLTTVVSEASSECSPLQEIGLQDVMRLELMAVQNAQMELLSDGRPEGKDYRCVGYTILESRLDGRPIKSLIGQRGERASVKVIATFLPQVVVDSLFAVLKRAGLQMKSLTLEPIAAITVAVPPTMRFLNLALVDVGAGTSDIAVTDGGTVIGYEMVPVAGDEITEELARLLLLDFNEADRLKRQLGEKEVVSFKDALGRSRQVESRDVVARLEPAVDRLASLISEAIMSVNGKPPQAVILVGGGSLTPRLPQLLAKWLGIEDEMVVIRGREMIKNLVGLPKRLSGPESVTPIGIALTALEYKNAAFSTVEVNGRNVRLFNLRQLRVADALLAAGIDFRKLHGKPGHGLTVEVNGELRIVKGTWGEPPQIERNGFPCGLETEIQNGDVIRVTPGRNGDPGRGQIRDVLPEFKPRVVEVNGQKFEVGLVVTMNGKPVSVDAELEDNAQISFREPVINDALNLFKSVSGTEDSGSILVYVNGKARELQQSREKLLVNGMPGSRDAVLCEGDQIELKHEPLTIRDVVQGEFKKWITLKVNEKPLRIDVFPYTVLRNKVPAAPDDLVKPGDVLEVKPSNGEIMFSHVFELVKFNPSPAASGKRLVMKVNGEDADFSTLLKDGDEVRFYWTD